MEKKPVDVECERTSTGMLIPKTIIWDDGRKFTISRVIYYSASPTGEYEGIRYTIMIGSAEKYIYLVNHMWYVIAMSGGGSSEEIHYL